MCRPEPATGVAPGGPGEVLAADDAGVVIACGDAEARGALRVTRLQRAGKGAMDAAQFLRGFPIAVGSVLT